MTFLNVFFSWMIDYGLVITWAYMVLLRISEIPQNESPEGMQSLEWKHQL